MRAMLMSAPGEPLELRIVPRPQPEAGQVLLRVLACAVCRTDLHVLDGELARPKLPLILGHEIVAEVAERGAGVDEPALGERIGVPWLGWTCGSCDFCARGMENLCDRARFTGYQIDGGYAEWAVADARFCLPLPEGFADVEAAPLLCAGLIGHRSLLAAGDAELIGLYGFGAAAHIVAQLARSRGQRIFAFTRPGDGETQRFARSLGVDWAGGSDEPPPEPLDAAILFAPVGALVPAALRAVRKGGTVVCAGIHMSEIPAFPYELLWGERRVVSVANLTRRDGVEFLSGVEDTGLTTKTRCYALERAGDALDDLRSGRLQGAAVIVPSLEGRRGRR